MAPPFLVYVLVVTKQGIAIEVKDNALKKRPNIAVLLNSFYNELMRVHQKGDNTEFREQGLPMYDLWGTFHNCFWETWPFYFSFLLCEMDSKTQHKSILIGGHGHGGHCLFFPSSIKSNLPNLCSCASLTFSCNRPSFNVSLLANLPKPTENVFHLDQLVWTPFFSPDWLF